MEDYRIDITMEEFLDVLDKIEIPNGRKPSLLVNSGKTIWEVVSMITCYCYGNNIECKHLKEYNRILSKYGFVKFKLNKMSIDTRLGTDRIKV